MLWYDTKVITYFGYNFDFLLLGINIFKLRLLGGAILRFCKISFDIFGANISKNSIRLCEVSLAFLRLILIDRLRTTELTKNVDGNILVIFLNFLVKKRLNISGFVQFLEIDLYLVWSLACISSTFKVCTSAAFVCRLLSLS